ncbi:Protein kinase domain-containing protein [Aphelenchoides besseyi]|nr:Protein kinase domain-containing protein [Aphelenchoides besseyi]
MSNKNEDTTGTTGISSSTTGSSTGDTTSGDNLVDQKFEETLKPAATPEYSDVEPKTLVDSKNPATSTRDAGNDELKVGHAMGFERSQQKYKLLSEIHRSSVATIFKVRSVTADKTKKEFYALKVEKVGVADFLRSDLNILDEVSRLKEENPKLIIQLPHLIDFGMTEKVRSVVMPLYWVNLHDLRSKVLKQSFFTMKTATRLNVQTLSAITALHRLKFIHGNVCIQNFMIDMDRHTVRLIDFSSGHFDKKIKREARKDNINQVFASRNVMRGKEAREHDDIESWVFLCFDLMEPQLLHWRKNNGKIYDKLPNSYKRLSLLLMSMQNDKSVDHGRFFQLINKPLVASNVQPQDLYEWEPGYASKKKEKKSSDRNQLASVDTTKDDATREVEEETPKPKDVKVRGKRTKTGGLKEKKLSKKKKPKSVKSTKPKDEKVAEEKGSNE